MDNEHVSKMGGASEQMTEAVRDSYQAVADGTVASQERGAKLAQGIFEDSMEMLRHQAETNRSMMEALVDGIERQQEAYQSMLRESLEAYMDLTNSALSYSRRGMENFREAAQEGAENTRGIAGEAAQQSKRTSRQASRTAQAEKHEKAQV